MKGVKHSEVKVQLSGEDGNVFAIIGRVVNAMKRAGVPKEEIEKYREEVFASNSYDEALQVTMKWVEVS